MSVIVTGGSGFIGSALVRRLVAQKERVLNIDKLTYAANPASLVTVEGEQNYSFLNADIVDRVRMRAAFDTHKPDLVFHCAAESHVDRSIDGPDVFIHTNIVGSWNLLNVARDYYQALDGPKRTKFRFIHISTDEVFGSLGNQGTFHEGSRYQPSSPYSASKAAADHLVRATHVTYQLPVIVTNCSNNFGPHQHDEKLIPTIIRKAVSHEPIPIYGRGENIRDWLFVEDHVDALLTIASRGTVGGSYNIGGGNEVDNIKMAKLICNLLDEILPKNDFRSYAEYIEFVTDRPGHDFRYAISFRKLTDELGWRPNTEFQHALRTTVNWYLERLQSERRN